MYKRQHDWLDKTLETLKANTDRPIIVKTKGYNPIIGYDKDGGYIVKGKDKQKPSGPIDWDNAYAIVTYNSNSLVNAIIDGIDVLADMNSCWSIYTGEPLLWLKYLAHCQYNSHENDSGEWFDCCNSWQQTVQ